MVVHPMNLDLRVNGWNTFIEFLIYWTLRYAVSVNVKSSVHTSLICAKEHIGASERTLVITNCRLLWIVHLRKPQCLQILRRD